jgi:hypothetical protein
MNLLSQGLDEGKTSNVKKTYALIEQLPVQLPSYSEEPFGKELWGIRVARNCARRR